MGIYSKTGIISIIPVNSSTYGTSYDKFKWNLKRMSNFNKFYNHDEDGFNLMKMMTSERIRTNPKRPLSIKMRMKLISTIDNYYIKRNANG